MPLGFKVEKKEAEVFAKIWSDKGIAILLPDSAIQFATDFANVVLRNFIDLCQQEALQKQKLEKKKEIVLEGLD